MITISGEQSVFAESVRDEVDLEVCVVGYALNPKKLRKRDFDVPKPAGGVMPQDASARSVWRGGGLADILSQHNSDGRPIVDGVQFCPWEWDKYAEDQPNFDVIIHKLTEDLDKVESTAKLEALRNYLLTHPSTVIVDPIERVRSVVSRACCCTALSTIQRRYAQQGLCCPFSQPKYFIAEVDRADFQGFDILMKAHDMQFPVICKPIKACGTPESHQMVVVVNVEGFRLVTSSCIVQQYYNHDGVFYKVYVIGYDVMVFQRPSLPNICTGGMRNVAFDSRYAYPVLDDFIEIGEKTSKGERVLDLPSAVPRQNLCSARPEITSSIVNESKGISVGGCSEPAAAAISAPIVETVSSPGLPAQPPVVVGAASSAAVRKRKPSGLDMPPNSPPSRYLHLERSASPPPLSLSSSDGNASAVKKSETHEDVGFDRFQAAAAEISREFGLTLFGFDVIIPSQDSIKDIVVIDVNYFPSYKEVIDFPHRLRRFLRSSKFSLHPQ